MNIGSESEFRYDMPEVKVVYNRGVLPDIGIVIDNDHKLFGCLVYRPRHGQWVTLADLTEHLDIRYLGAGKTCAELDALKSTLLGVSKFGSDQLARLESAKVEIESLRARLDRAEARNRELEGVLEKANLLCQTLDAYGDKLSSIPETGVNYAIRSRQYEYEKAHAALQPAKQEGE